MNMRQAWGSALQELAFYRILFWQAMLGFIIGAMGISITFSVGLGLLNQVEEQVKMYPETLLYVTVGTQMNAERRITLEDLQQLAADNPQILREVSLWEDYASNFEYKGFYAEVEAKYGKQNIFYVDVTKPEQVPAARALLNQLRRELMGNDGWLISESAEQMRDQLSLPYYMLLLICSLASCLAMLLGGVSLRQVFRRRAAERFGRRSMRADRQRIGQQLKLEAFCTSAIGGGLGIILGPPLGYLICRFCDLAFVLPLIPLLLALGLALGIGFVAGRGLDIRFAEAVK